MSGDVLVDRGNHFSYYGFRKGVSDHGMRNKGVCNKEGDAEEERGAD